MKRLIWNLLIDEDGPTAVEYAVMLGLILAACLAAVTSLGEQTSDAFQNAHDQIDQYANGDA